MHPTVRPGQDAVELLEVLSADLHCVAATVPRGVESTWGSGWEPVAITRHGAALGQGPR
jgi:hypothetical protein